MKKINNISTIILSLFIIYINIGSLTLALNRNITSLMFSKIYYVFTILFLILYIINKIKIEKKIKIKDILIVLLSLFGFISYQFAISKYIALNGFVNRNEGLLMLYNYYLSFLLASTLSNKNKEKIYNVIIITGLFQISIGLIQFLRIDRIFPNIKEIGIFTKYKFASGTFLNTNFYSTYILICLMYVYGKISSYNKKEIKNYILLFIFIIGLIIGNTMSCILSLSIILTISFILKLNKENLKKSLSYLIVFIVCLSIFFTGTSTIFHTKFKKNIHKNINEITSIFKGGIDDNTGSGRIGVWKYAISKLPKYYLTGIGIDNFAIIDKPNSYCIPNNGRWLCFDKVHNEYLQKLITEGIFSFITYLSLLVYVLYKGKKNNNNIFYKAYIAYMIQAIFNISVIEVAPLFYITMGLNIENNEK